MGLGEFEIKLEFETESELELLFTLKDDNIELEELFKIFTMLFCVSSDATSGAVWLASAG